MEVFSKSFTMAAALKFHVIITLTLILHHMCGSSGIDSKKTLQVLRNRSICNKYYGIHINQTFSIISRGISIAPLCAVSFWSYQKNRDNTRYVKSCLKVVDIQLPCIDNNRTVLTLSTFKTWKDKKGYSHVNDTMSVEEESFICGSETPLLPFQLCSHHYHVIFQWKLLIPKLSKQDVFKLSFESVEETVLLRQPPMFSVHHSGTVEDSNTIAVEVPNKNYICTPDGTCNSVIFLPSVALKEEDEDDNKLDVNNLVTIVVGGMSSLFVPVAILYVRNRIISKSPEDERTEKAESFDKELEIINNSADVESQDE